MIRAGTYAAIVLTLIGSCCAANPWAADMPVKAPPAAADSTPKPCTTFEDFIATNCQLTWHGITVYGTVDAGVGWQSHGAPLNPWSAPGASYLIQKMNRSPMWTLAPNGLSQSTIGIKGTEPIGNGFSFVFALDAGFDPYSLRFANGPHSLYSERFTPLDQQTTNSDSSRAGQWYNGVGYVGKIG